MVVGHKGQITKDPTTPIKIVMVEMMRNFHQLKPFALMIKKITTMPKINVIDPRYRLNMRSSLIGMGSWSCISQTVNQLGKLQSL